MKTQKILLVGLACIFSGLMLNAQTTVIYSYTGAVQTFVVPACVTSIIVDASGGKGGNNGGVAGGMGGRVQATIPVTPGETLNVYVGELGINTSTNSPAGYNGGGGVYSYVSAGTAGTGGGASDIRRSPYTSANRLVVAGGGGGGGYTNIGGHGGGLIGQDGVPYPTFPNSGGKGGSQVIGGDAGVACCSCPTYTTAGALAQGGNGAGDGAGGGGGGYYGGGGSCFAGGGGGSSYTDPSATAVTHTQGYNSGAGQISITYTPGPVLPTPGSISGPTSVCENDTATYSIGLVVGATGYTWTLPAGWTGSSTINSITVIASNTSGNVEVSAYDGCGSSTPATLPVTINTLPVVGSTISPNDTVCNGASVTLTGTGSSTSYIWTGGVTNAAPFAASATQTYTVTGTDVNGCSNTATSSLTVNSLPTVGFAVTSNDSICEGGSVTLNGTGASSYSWTGGISDGVSFFPVGSGNYTVTGTDAEGCTNSSTASIVVITLPVISLGSDVIQASPPATLDAGSGFSSYLWSTTATTQTISVTTNGTYITTVTNSFGCENSDTVQVFFTAGIVNNDGSIGTISMYPNPVTNVLNLKIDHIETENMVIEIFDMHGKLVYNRNIGSINGNGIQIFDVSDLNAGTYFLKVMANGKSDELKFILSR